MSGNHYYPVEKNAQIVVVPEVVSMNHHKKQALRNWMVFLGRRVMRNLVFVVLVFLAMSGCMTAKLSGLERASDTIKEETYHGNGWCRGRSRCGCWEDEKSCDRTLGSVQVRYNYFHALAAVLSFGIYMPIEIDHRLNPKGVEGHQKNETY